MTRFRVNYTYRKPNSNSKCSSSKIVSCLTGIEAMIIIKSHHFGYIIEFKNISLVK